MKPLVFLGGLFLVALSARAASITFTDNAFNLANYSEMTNKSNPAIGITFAQCPSCGNPGQALQIMVSQTANGDSSTIGFVNNTFLYNPFVQGAINTIDASVDKLFNTNQPVDPNTTYGNTFRPLIEQAGMFYLAAIPGPNFNGGSTGYLNFAQSGLTASDFVEFDFTTGVSGTTHPNFAGDPLLFGLAQHTQAASPDMRAVNFEFDYDNLNLTIHSAPDSGSSILLMAGSVAMLVMLQRHFVRRQTIA